MATTAALDTELIAPLESLSQTDLERAGGKAANLGELIRAGFAVPPGFVLTTTAYTSLLREAGLDEHIRQALAHLDVHNPASVQQASQAIQTALLDAPIPTPIATTVLEAYHALGAGAVAVRSSATAEDLPEAAFAGQQDTFLNVIGDNALLDAVRRCWASLWTERAITYRNRQGIDQTTVKLAVVVQRMVAVESAGVMFTANPVTGARNEIVIDASPGLGEAIVSGLVTPDHYLLRKGRWRWRIAERRLGRREVIIRARSGGGTEHIETLDSAATQIPSLPDSALRQLADLGVAIERHFGRPQDVEWARTGADLFIVQARPMTALPEPPPGRAQQLVAQMVAELFPVRPYPLDHSAWLSAVSGAVTPLFDSLGVVPPPFPELFVEEDGVAVRFRGNFSLRPTPALALMPLRLLWTTFRYNPARWETDPVLTQAVARVRELDARELHALSVTELLATLRDTLTLPRLLAGETRRRYFPRTAVAAGLLRLLLRALHHSDRLGVLLSGVETKTLEANRALESLAAKIRSDPTLVDAFANHEANELSTMLEQLPSGHAFLADLQAFLDRYGHREAMIASAFHPTWKDAPEVVLGLLKGLALSEPRPHAERPAWETARDEVLAHPALRFPPFRSAFLKLLTSARYLLQIREDTHFYATLSLPIVRRIFLEFGGRLVNVGVLDSAEDIFHLKLDELERLSGTWPPPDSSTSDLRAAVLRRKQRRAELEDTPLIDPRFLPRPEVEGDVLLRGTPGSPGVAEGPVRVIHDASEFGELRAGDVLVAPYTNPAWTPLFQRAVAVVVDSGSTASHAAIVAREYGIPAVMGTTDGTRRLTDGLLVGVDGSRGLVFNAAPPTSDHNSKE